jgi:hypothetical protein
MKKKVKPQIVNNWTVTTEYVVGSKTIYNGDIIRIDGEQGKRFIFNQYVYNHDNDKEWIDCNEVWKGAPGMFRSFRPDRIRTIGGRKGKQKARPKSTGDADAIRSWAKENNIPVSERGRISSAVREQYYAAQGQGTV